MPELGSLILTHDADGEIRGLNEFAGRASAGGCRSSSPFASWSASAC